MLVIGLMSGTSLDGIDAALVSFARADDVLQLRLERFATLPFDEALRARLFALLPPRRGSVAEVCELHVLVGEAFAQAAIAVAGQRLGEAALIGSHGQTIYHQVASGRTRSTLQIGAAAVIAERTGCTVVSDFRARDVAAGGQGAPLVPLLDALLLRGPRTRVALNLGGIANITWLPPIDDGRWTMDDGAQPVSGSSVYGQVLAFDTGPGNVLIDCAASLLSDGALRFDQDGAWAAGGLPDERLLRRWLAHPFFRQPPPRSTGREAWGRVQARRYVAQGQARGLNPAEIMATITALTARSVAHACFHLVPHPPDELLVSGGGVHNRTLMAQLAAALPDVAVQPLAHFGVDPDAKEALAFALLAYATVCGWPGNLPGATGATHPVVLGALTPGRDYAALLAALANAGPLPQRAVMHTDPLQ